jgi:hypothetical protein
MMQIAFGLTLFFDPSAIGRVWPWAMTELATRLLAASTLVSVPLAIGPAVSNRYSIARIPYVMMLLYRLLQLTAGVIHLGKFDFGKPAAWNYFVGGGLMLAVLGYALVAGPRLGRAVEGSPGWLPPDRDLAIGRVGGWLMDAAGAVFMGLGIVFLLLGSQAGSAWIEGPGALTPLTARLFASPLIGLAVGLWLIVRAARWHQVIVPAVGMATFGVVGSLALVLSRGDVVISGIAGVAVAATPAILLATGIYLLLPTGRASRRVQPA